jgi:hypothetical protein
VKHPTAHPEVLVMVKNVLSNLENQEDLNLPPSTFSKQLRSPEMIAEDSLSEFSEDPLGEEFSTEATVK